MLSTVDRNVYFYSVRFLRDANRVGPGKVFAYVNSLTFDETGRYFTKKDGDIWSMFVDRDRSPVRFRLGTKRKNGLPLLEKQGKTSPFKLKPDEGLFEQAHSVLFASNGDQPDVIGSEFNFHAPRITTLTRYLPEKASQVVDEVLITPLVRNDAEAQLQRIGEIKVLQMRIHRSLASQVAELDSSLSDAFKSSSDTSDAEDLEIVLRSRRYSRRGLKVDFLDNIVRWLKKPDVRDKLVTFNIKAKTKDDGKTELFDLMQQYVLSTEHVIKHDLAHRSVDSKAMYQAIEDSCENLKEEIHRAMPPGVD